MKKKQTKKKKKPIRYLSPDQLHFNRETQYKKGNPRKDKAAKRYLFGHFTNVRKGRA